MQSETIAQRLQSGARSGLVQALLSGTDTHFALAGEMWACEVRVRDGMLDVGEESASETRYRLVADDTVWAELLASDPTPGRHSLVALVRSGDITLTGSVIEYERTVHIARAVVEGARSPQSPLPLGKPLAAVGRYHRVTTALGTSDVYVERAGAGTPLLAFATAGSDVSQWHGVMTHTDVADHYELITVDLPWHGKSAPAWGAVVGSYALNPETYTEFIVACADALQLERPVLVGVSMGGGAVVHAVATHPERFAGAVSCQAGPSVTARANQHLRGTRLNAATFIPEWTYGLMNPASPQEFRQRVWWGYSSGGFGLYAADIDSYLQWDVATVQALLTEQTPHIAVLSGAYDTSVPTARSRELAALIPNASFTEMPELGHFPHAEHPERFARYLLPAIERVLAH